MRASVPSLSALCLAFLAAACLPATARTGIVFAHGVGAHFHGGHDIGHRHHHHFGNTLGGGIDTTSDDNADAPQPVSDEPPLPPAPQGPRLFVEYTPPPPVSEGPRIIILDHRKSHKPRGRMPVIIYGNPAS